MDGSRTVRALSIAMSAVLVLGIMYLAVGERLGIKSAGPNANHFVEAPGPK
jgi:hypothetical protein